MDIVKKTQRSGVKAHCSFIFGLIGDTLETMDETLNFALSLKPDTASFSIAIPFPGTQMFQDYDNQGLLDSYNWDDYSALEPVFETDVISRGDLVKMYKKAHRVFYFRPHYIWRQIRSTLSITDFIRKARIGLNLMLGNDAYKK